MKIMEIMEKEMIKKEMLKKEITKILKESNKIHQNTEPASYVFGTEKWGE